MLTKRKGAFTCYLEAWDLEVFDFIELRKTSGEERRRARDLFLAISYPDIFFEREEENGDWILFDPRDVPMLTETFGDVFRMHYLQYEREYLNQNRKFNPNTRIVKARDVLREHIKSWSDIGMPFMMFKDNVNKVHKYSHLGPIRSSNLCCFTGDTVVYSAVLNNGENKQYSIKELAEYSQGTNTFGLLTNVANGKSRYGSYNIMHFEAVAYKTGTKEVITVELENNLKFRCTPEHRLALVNGGFVEAEYSKGCLIYTVDGKGTRVRDIIYTQEVEDVYDITLKNVDNKHQDDLVFYILIQDGDNFVIPLVHNCEVVVYTDDNYTGVCNLGSINLARTNTEDDLKRVTKLALRIMDNCIDLTKYPSDKARNFQRDFRACGCGSMGEAEYIANKQIMFGSEEHKQEIDRIWSTIKNTLLETSKELAEEKGECKHNPGYRNAYFSAIAPNSSSAIMAGTTNGLEPVYNKIWVEENKRGSYIMTAPYININNIEYYKNPYEIDMFKQLDVAAVRQKHIDMAMSINLFLDPNGLSVKKVRDLVVHAWKNGLKTLYYLRSKPPKTTGVTNDNGISCVGCIN